VARLLHLAARAADHHLAQRLGLGVALAVVHAPAHVRVQAQVMVAHQHLAFAQLGCLHRHQPEVAGRGFALRPVVEQDLTIDGHDGSPDDY